MRGGGPLGGRSGGGALAPLDKHGARLVRLELDSKATGRQLGVNAIVPKRAGPRGKRRLLAFLRGRGGNG